MPFGTSGSLARASALFRVPSFFQPKKRTVKVPRTRTGMPRVNVNPT